MDRLQQTAVACLGVVLLVAIASAVDGGYCYKDDPDKYFMFSSKTVYEFVRMPHQGREIMPHCTPVQVWWLNRHGTRYPGKETIANMEKLWNLRDTILVNHAEKTGQLCDEDLDALREWRLRVNASLENVLTAAGEEELRLTGERLRSRFPEALDQTYSARKYKFRHTMTQRTERSARMFARGMFPPGDAVAIPPAEEKDMLLKPYASCTAWQEDDKTDPPEYSALVGRSDVQRLVKDVSTRLGYLGSLKFEDVKTMFDMCRFDKAWDVENISPWCAAFTKEQIELMEYAEDLRYYYTSGYGDDRAVKLGCPLTRDLWERFRLLAEGSQEQPLGVFYFAHSSTLHMLQARLGMFRDAEPLRADNRDAQTNRLWRVSKMGSFAATLGAVFYRCSSRDEGNSSKVLFLSGEGTVDVQGCRLGFCTWEQARALLQPLAEQCNLDWCEPHSSAAALPPRVAPLVWAATAAAALLFALAARAY